MNEWGRFRVEIKQKKGQFLEAKFPKGKQKGEERIKSRETTLLDEGITKDESSNARLLFNEPQLVKEAMDRQKPGEYQKSQAVTLAPSLKDRSELTTEPLTLNRIRNNKKSKF